MLIIFKTKVFFSTKSTDKNCHGNLNYFFIDTVEWGFFNE